MASRLFCYEASATGSIPVAAATAAAVATAVAATAAPGARVDAGPVGVGDSSQQPTAAPARKRQQRSRRASDMRAALVWRTWVPRTRRARQAIPSGFQRGRGRHHPTGPPGAGVRRKPRECASSAFQELESDAERAVT